ncbi:MAG: sodium/panthothenate symporter [Streptosporangiales bacterium]|nr:sodium/panthothenate symporter [Streptosporangiales bacterium]
MTALLITGILYLVVLLVLGIVARRATNRQEATTARAYMLEYYLAGRKLGWVALLFTTAATFYSAGTFIGAPGLAFDAGYVWPLAVAPQHLAMAILFLLTGAKFAIVARKLGFITPMDFFRARYRSTPVVLIGGLATVFFLIVYIAPQFVGGARIFESATGLPYTTTLIVFLVVVSAYTIYGGFRAVVMTDILQGVAMTAGAIALWAFIIARVGDLEPVHRDIAQTDPDLLHLGTGAFAIVITGYVTFSLSGVAQPQIMLRAMAYRTSKDMYRAVVAGVLVVTLFSSTFMILGVIARGLFPDLDTPDQAIPNLILTYVPSALAGLVLAAPLAAVMSTIDSMLLLNTSVVAKDIYVNYINKNASIKQVKVVSVVAGIVMTLIVLWLTLEPPAFLETLVIYALGGLTATFWAPLLFGLYWKRGNKYGALASMLGGIPVYVLLDRLVDTGDLGAVVIALPVAIVLYVVVSLLTPPPPREVIQDFWGRRPASVPASDAAEG